MFIFLQEAIARERIIANVWLIKDVMWQSVNNILASIVERLPYVLAGLLVLLLFWFLSKIIKAIFWKASTHTKLDSRLRVLFSRLIVIFICFLGVFTALTVIIPTFKFSDLIAGLGFTSFVIGFATKDILNNLLSGILILWQQPFKIGDYIFIGSNQGKIEYIGIRATHLRKDDGELVLIPNADMYSSAITVRRAGAERRMNLKISIGYDADVVEAKEIIRNVLQSEPSIVDEPKSSVIVTDLSSSGVDLAIYFWVNTDTHQPLQVFDALATEIKKVLGEAGIKMYPPSSLIVETPEQESRSISKIKEFKKKDGL